MEALWVLYLLIRSGLREIGIDEVVEVFVCRLSCLMLAVLKADAFPDDSWMERPDWGFQKRQGDIP